MNDIAQVLLNVAAIIGALTVVGTPFLFMYGRKYFAEVSQAVNPLELEKRWVVWAEIRDDKLKEMSHEIRDAVNSSIGSVAASNRHQYEHILSEVTDLKKGMRETLKKAELAIEKATIAHHQADLANAKVDANKELVVARLKHIEDSVDSLAKRRSKEL